VSLLLVVVGAQLLNNVLKDAFQRERPTPVTGLISAQQFSFPSGHAMVSAAFYLFLAYMAWKLIRGRWQRALMVGGLVLLVLLIGISRLYLEAHYLTDVIAGYLAGVLWAESVILGGWVLTMRTQSRDARGTAKSTV
jgi:undecaprenyl-diphosphatase